MKTKATFQQKLVELSGLHPPIVKPKKAPKMRPMTFEQALRHLRRGKRVRRRLWNEASSIFRHGDDVFIKLPNSYGGVQNRPSIGSEYGSAPDFWKPYPSDFLANDWMVVR